MQVIMIGGDRVELKRLLKFRIEMKKFHGCYKISPQLYSERSIGPINLLDYYRRVGKIWGFRDVDAKINQTLGSLDWWELEGSNIGTATITEARKISSKLKIIYQLLLEDLSKIITASGYTIPATVTIKVNGSDVPVSFKYIFARMGERWESYYVIFQPESAYDVDRSKFVELDEDLLFRNQYDVTSLSTPAPGMYYDFVPEGIDPGDTATQVVITSLFLRQDNWNGLKIIGDEKRHGKHHSISLVSDMGLISLYHPPMETLALIAAYKAGPLKRMIEKMIRGAKIHEVLGEKIISVPFLNRSMFGLVPSRLYKTGYIIRTVDCGSMLVDLNNPTEINISDQDPCFESVIREDAGDIVSTMDEDKFITMHPTIVYPNGEFSFELKIKFKSHAKGYLYSSGFINIDGKWRPFNRKWLTALIKLNTTLTRDIISSAISNALYEAQLTEELFQYNVYYPRDNDPKKLLSRYINLVHKLEKFFAALSEGFINP